MPDIIEVEINELKHYAAMAIEDCYADQDNYRPGGLEREKELQELEAFLNRLTPGPAPASPHWSLAMGTCDAYMNSLKPGPRPPIGEPDLIHEMHRGAILVGVKLRQIIASQVT